MPSSSFVWQEQLSNNVTNVTSSHTASKLCVSAPAGDPSPGGDPEKGGRAEQCQEEADEDQTRQIQRPTCRELTSLRHFDVN